MGGAGMGGSSSSASSTGVGGSGYCDTSANCDGYPCIPIVPGGFRTCWLAYLEASNCTGSNLDECCDSGDCIGGTCQQWPAKPYCGGAPIEFHNVCVTDECSSSADCGPGMACAAAGTIHNKMRICIPAWCEVDADCTAEPGGICGPIASPCCYEAVSLGCVYPSDGCMSEGDCPGTYCMVGNDGRAKCATSLPSCPP
jgi:hypothetical protein